MEPGAAVSAKNEKSPAGGLSFRRPGLCDKTNVRPQRDYSTLWVKVWKWWSTSMEVLTTPCSLRVEMKSR